MAVAGTLEIQLLANVARLQSDMNQAKSSVTGAMKGIESAVGSAKAALGALGIGLSVVGFANLIKGSIDAMDRLNDLSKSTGITVENLAGLKLLARQTGTDLDGLAKGINKMSVEMGKDPEAFRRLGITATDNVARFRQLADVFNALPDISQRNALANKIFGKSWAELAPALSEGGDKIGEIVEKGAKASGVTGEMAKKADELNDKWALLVGNGGLVNKVVESQLDPMLQLTNWLIKATEASDGLFKSMWKFANTPPPAALKIRGWLGMGPDLNGGMGLGSGPRGGRANTDRDVAGASAAANDYLGVGAAERAAAAKAAAKVIADAQKAELASRTEVARLTQELRAQEIADGYELEKLHEAWSAEEKKIADEKLAASALAVDAIRVSLLTEQELMAEHYNRQIADLVVAREQKAITDAQYNEFALALEDQHQLELKGLAEKGYTERQKFAALSTKNQSKQVLGELANLTAGVAQHNRTMFEINKASGIGMALINAYEGISLTMKTYPYPLNIAMAAAHGIAAFAQIQAIRSTTFGGGGGAPSIAGSTPAPPVTPVFSAAPGAGSGQSTVINLHGETFGRKQVKALVEQINENSKDGGRIVFA